MRTPEQIAAGLVAIKPARIYENTQQVCWFVSVCGFDLANEYRSQSQAEELAAEARRFLADALRLAVHEDRSTGWKSGDVLDPERLAELEGRLDRLDDTPAGRVEVTNHRLAAIVEYVPALLAHARALQLLLHDDGFRETVGPLLALLRDCRRELTRHDDEYRHTTPADLTRRLDDVLGRE